MILGAPRFGARGVHLEQAGVAMRLEVDPHRAQVANDLAPRLVEGDVEHALSAETGGSGEPAGGRVLRAAGGSRDRQAGAAVVPPVEHRVEPRYARGYALRGHVVLEVGV